MKKTRIAVLVLLSVITSASQLSATQLLWRIGDSDGRPDGMALSPGGYRDYVRRDFGWEDRFYLVGYSDPSRDFAYILPSVDDEWAGSGYMSGPHSQAVNIFFDVTDKGKGEGWKLGIDFTDTHSIRPPLVKVSVNGRNFSFVLPKGGGDGSAEGDYSSAKPYHITIPLASGDLRSGHNQILITALEGSWSVFDSVWMEAPDGSAVRDSFGGAYVRDVRAAAYQIDGCQPLLVEAEYLDGSPLLDVRLDGKSVYSKRLEKGSYCLEVPMPSVRRRATSDYEILLDGKSIRTGSVLRTPQPEVRESDYVNTAMGTSHSRWMLAPGPWMPFSMVKLSPDNQRPGWQGGYDGIFESVGTFSHIHEWTMAGLGTMPVCGPLKTEMGDPSAISGHADGYRSYIDRNSEICEAGYYAVHLTDYDIYAELTATDRCGFQRYTYPAGAVPRVMIDLKVPAEYGYELPYCTIRKVGPRRIEGISKQVTRNVWSDDADQDYTVYFVIEFDRDIKSFGGWSSDGTWSSDSMAAENASRFGCWVEFDPSRGGTVLKMRSGLSFVDLEGASANLEREVSGPHGWSFESVMNAQKAAWDDILGRVKVKSDDRMEKVRFYTNLYRSFCRNTFSDADGRWMSQGDVVRNLREPDARAMGCDAFWNTFWNLNQLWNLMAPEWSSRWVRSQLAMYESDGWLGKGPAGMKYIPVMVAEHEIPLMVSAYQMGIRDYDTEKLFEAVRKMQVTPASRVGRGFAGNRDLSVYLKYHYVPADKGRFSNTLEYSFDDWTVAQLALSMGKMDEYEYFIDRGYWWRNAIDPEGGYARMRYSDGSWERQFDPFRSGANRHYVEGNAWQLTEFVPQDVPALGESVGRHRLANRLAWGFEESEKFRFNAPGEAYWSYPVVQGNQQSLHFAFLFNWLGRPWETQKWSRAIMDRYYGCGRANAWLGDEDQGQMSAWFVMASLGLFQMDGGCSAEPHFELASPSFEEVVIDLGGRYGRGEKFVIKAAGASRKNIYVSSASLNGKVLDSFLIPAEEILKGGMLEVDMTDEADHGLWRGRTDGGLDNGEQWNDTEGNRINAHGGGMMFHEGRYYWYGECKCDSTYWNPNVPGWECYRTEAGGVNCYSSENLMEWKYEGVVLKPEMEDRSSELHRSKVIERPKVIFNEKTGKFVMWMHIDSDTYGYAHAGVAVSDSPLGPFRYLGSVRPHGSDSRDMTLYKDDDGKAYLLTSSEGNSTLYISLLSDDYLSLSDTYTRNFAGGYREAPAVCKRGGKYYIISSGCTGWSPNQAEYAVADNILGPWTVKGNPCSGPDADKTFYAQSTFLLPVEGGDGSFVAMFDEWHKTDLINSAYIWLPVQFDDETGGMEIPWKDKWINE